MTKRERKALAQALGRLAAGKAKTMTDAARAQRKAAALASADARRKPAIDLPEEDFEPRDGPARCPHGEEWHECNACMIAGDLEFDAARERRL